MRFLSRLKHRSFFLFPALILLVLLPVLSGCGKNAGTVSPAATSVATASSSEASVVTSPEISSSGTAAASGETAATDGQEAAPALSEDGSYTSKEDVALYLHTYGHLPSNFLTKKEAQSRGWEASKGNLQKVAPGMSIGGDRFGNREGLLPEKKGRQYYECDIDYEGGSRNAKRIVYSDDGLIFFTDDHYASFEQLY